MRTLTLDWVYPIVASHPLFRVATTRIAPMEQIVAYISEYKQILYCCSTLLIYNRMG
jgi:hypothetical protein